MINQPGPKTTYKESLMKIDGVHGVLGTADELRIYIHKNVRDAVQHTLMAMNFDGRTTYIEGKEARIFEAPEIYFGEVAGDY